MSTFQKVFVVILLSINTFLCQYNYLCDFNTKFTENTPGSWTPQSGCEVSQDSTSSSGPVAWLGGDVATRSWTDYTIESTFRFTQTSSASWSGIIFRANSIGNNWDSGNYYYVGLVSNENKIYNSKFYNNNFAAGTSVSISISGYTDYKLTIHVIGNSWYIYLNDVYRHYGSDSSFSAGSVGLRTYGAAVRFKTLYITLPTQAPTKNPTNQPSISPTNFPTISPTTTTTTTSTTTSLPTTVAPTAIPTTSDPTTSQPTTAQPTTDAPTTAMPTNMPSMTPTVFPTTTEPTTARPTTNIPTTVSPTTHSPSTSAPSMSPTTPSPTNTLHLPEPTPAPTLPNDGNVVNDITTSENVDITIHGDEQGNKIAEQVLILEDWVFIVGGGLFAVFCMACMLFVFCMCKRITGRKQKQKDTDSYNMTAEMVKVTSISNFDTYTNQVQNNITSVSPSAEISNDTGLTGLKDVKNMIASKSNDALMMHAMASLTPMGFDEPVYDDFMQDGNTCNTFNVELTDMTRQNTDPDSVMVDTFHDGSGDMIIESSDDDTGGEVAVTMGGKRQETLGNDNEEDYVS